MADTIIGAAAAPVMAFLLAKIGEISADQRNAKLLERYRNRVAFWQSWVNAQALVCAPEQLERVKETARVALDAIRQDMNVLGQKPSPVNPPKSRIRRGLLLYGANRPAVWLPRAAFYLFSIYAVLLLSQLLIDANMRSATMLPIALCVVVLVLFLGFWSRITAIRMEN
jgi:hypothetical protein